MFAPDINLCCVGECSSARGVPLTTTVLPAFKLATPAPLTASTIATPLGTCSTAQPSKQTLASNAGAVLLLLLLPKQPSSRASRATRTQAEQPEDCPHNPGT